MNNAVLENKSPLMIAIESGSAELFKMLIQNKADVNFCSSDGNTPLICAIKSVKPPRNLKGTSRNHKRTTKSRCIPFG